MQITKLIDAFGDDIFAFALIVTKDFNSAKEVFIKTCSAYEEFDDNTDICDIIRRAYSECENVDSNEGASVLTGVELSTKLQPILEELLAEGELDRTVAHMFYENDLTEDQIADLTGKSVKFISELLSDNLSALLRQNLEKHYKDICARIHADDKLKLYVIRSVTDKSRRTFEVRNEAVPRHSWTTAQKVTVFIAAFIVMLIIGFLIPIYEQFKDQDMSSYENLSSGESFYYTYEADGSE